MNSSDGTMTAQVIREFGDPSVFEEAEIDRPTAGAGEVVIEVHATSVNPVDFKIRNGSGSSIAPEFPAVLQGDAAGVIHSVGSGVTEFVVGDEVYTCAGGFREVGNGALAEYMLADAALVARKPTSLSMREAAALPLVSITAWDGIVDRADVEPGENVLVHGATGGVGHVALQLAKRSGGIVHATASSAEKLEIGRELGADHAINYRTESVEEYVEKYTDGAGFDVVFDSVGSGEDNIQPSFEAAAPKGRVITTSAGPDEDLSILDSRGLTLEAVYMLIEILYDTDRERHGKILTRLANLVDAGDVKPLLDETRFSLDEIADAHRRVESGDHIGKVVVDVASPDE